MQTALAQRYAKTLISVANQNMVLDTVEKDFLLVAEVLKGNNQFGEFLASPIHKRDQKTQLIQNAFGSKIHEVSMNFIGLLIRNWRAALLPEVIEEFLLMMEKSNGLQRATIISAKTIDEVQFNHIDEVMSKKLGSKLIWTRLVDASLVAGFRIRIGDTVIDHSLSLKLKELEKQLMAKA